jgi:hypothetical protein
MTAMENDAAPRSPAIAPQPSGSAPNGRWATRWRVARWSAAGALLLLPAVAMQFTDEVNWDGRDFLFAAVLIIGAGVAFEFAIRVGRSLGYRTGAAVAIANAFLMTWANAAVGIIGDEGNAFNGVFIVIVLVTLVASAIVRFRPRGLATVMGLAACAQLLAAAAGYSQDVRGAVLSCFFVGMWVLAALLFHRAARRA